MNKTNQMLKHYLKIFKNHPECSCKISLQQAEKSILASISCSLKFKAFIFAYKTTKGSNSK